MTEVIIAQRMYQRRDTATNWEAKNPVLQAGEIGVELSTTAGVPHKTKIGDGSTPWSTLPYQGGGTVQEHVAETDPHTQYVLESALDAAVDSRINAQKGQPNGIAALDANSTIDGGNF